MSRLRPPEPEPRRVPAPVREGDVETWVSVAREPLQDRLGQIASLCRRFMASDAHPTTAYGLARDVLAIADAEIEARDRAARACRCVYVIQGGRDVCVICKEGRPL